MTVRGKPFTPWVGVSVVWRYNLVLEQRGLGLSWSPSALMLESLQVGPSSLPSVQGPGALQVGVSSYLSAPGLEASQAVASLVWQFVLVLRAPLA